MAMIRLGVLGLSQWFYATAYTRFLATLSGVRVVGVCHPDGPDTRVTPQAPTARELASEVDARVFETPAQLMDSGVDAVIITTETWRHVEDALLALRAGCHVLVGKPLAFRSTGLDALAEFSREQRLLVLPGQPARYEDGMMAAARRIKAGEIGRPIMGRVFVNHLAMTDPAWEADVAKSGGTVGTFAIYCTDLIQWLMGDRIREIMAYGGNFTHTEFPWPDNLKAVARLSGGGLASMDLTCSIQWEYPFLEAEIIGESGALRVTYAPVATSYRPDGLRIAGTPAAGPDAPRVMGDPFRWPNDGFRYSPMNFREPYHFIQCVRQEAEPAVTLEDAIAAIRAVEAIERSLAQRGPVHVSNGEVSRL